MVVKLYSSALYGIDALEVEVEVHYSSGLPSFNIVGLPDNAVKEARDRINSSIKNTGFRIPPGRITVNLAPADLKKQGTCYDLPIAVGVLIACNLISVDNTYENIMMIGELSLDGRIRPVKGVLSSVIKAKTYQGIVVPSENEKEANIVKDINIFPASHIMDVIELLKGNKSFKKTKGDSVPNYTDKYEEDFSDVKGQKSVKRAIVIAAAGNHNILMIGPPGTGKSMLARRIPSILPPMSMKEILEVTKIYSVSGLLDQKQGLIIKRPFRAPHHNISDAGLIGGGSNPTPGEITLAHNGVLFLDELPEFKRNTLEMLRQPMEEKKVVIARATRSVSFPANFMFVGAMNPCPCGYYMSNTRNCTCTSTNIQRYLHKISGPLLDRIDIHIEVPEISAEHLYSSSTEFNSQQMKEMVINARKYQRHRFSSTLINYNSQMTPKMIEKFCPLKEKAKKLLKEAINNVRLSARAYHRIIKLARTIADLEEKEKIEEIHIAEAIQYRVLDSSYWNR